MLIQPTMDKLYDLNLKGMAQALQEILNRTDTHNLSFEEKLGLIVDRQHLDRQESQLKRRLKSANLKGLPCVEDIDYRHPRGLDRAVMQDLTTCRWIKAKANLVLCGATGLGKTWLANALAHKACRDGLTVYNTKVHRLVHELALARADGSYLKLLTRLAKYDVLILDDWALSPLEGEAMHSILEVIDDRAGVRSTILTSQLPVKKWHAMVADPSVADAILDRIVNTAIQINLKGESMRKIQSNHASSAPQPGG